MRGREVWRQTEERACSQQMGTGASGGGRGFGNHARLGDKRGGEVEGKAGRWMKERRGDS